jgi:quercetin dioxygenase-like cupin family protein
MPQPRETADLARRDLLRLGLVGASVLALGAGGSILAGDEGVERKVLKEVDSNIPGFPKLRIRDTIFQPGAVLSERTMANPMICEVTQGTLEVTVDGKTFTALQGDFWTCRAGGTEADANTGTTVAIMHVIDLLPA